jgi:fatty-acyl-CoA synthase
MDQAMLNGLMMDFPLTLHHLLARAAQLYPNVEIVHRTPSRSLVRRTYRDLAKDARRLASALTTLGVGEGTRVATLAWNHADHLAAYFAIPNMGAVVHTLNLRLSPDELAFIAADAGDHVVLVDASLLPLWERFRERVPCVKHVVVMQAADDAVLPHGALRFEELLSRANEQYEFPEVSEHAASMLCYTSGTTGNPKGVLYSHRSTVLHALASCMADSLGITSRDVVFPVVPMFHAAAWGVPYAATMVGAKLVMPGPALDATSLLELMDGERVTFAAGVPTIWLGILDLLDREPKKYDLHRIRTMVIGGAAAPPALIAGFEARHNLHVTHAWGMTETNPLGSVAHLKPSLAELSAEQRLSLRATQGLPVPFVEARHRDADGKILPWDGQVMGELEVRGPWVAKGYFGGAGTDRFTDDGWFRTGDVVTIDGEGYITITDRDKDVIKSGGEWISSVALENALMAHPAVLEAAVFAGQHAKWSERPIAAICLRAGQDVGDEALSAFLAEKFPKFWLPDAYVRVSQIPRTSTGKFLKSKLRQEHGAMLLK